MVRKKNRRKEILKFIKTSIDKNGYPPTVREIADNVGLSSSSTVHGHLDRLEREGYIKRDPNKPRTILVVNKETESVENTDREVLITRQYKGSFVKQFNIHDNDYIVIKENANKGVALAIQTMDGSMKVTGSEPSLKPQDMLIGAVVGVFKAVE